MNISNKLLPVLLLVTIAAVLFAVNKVFNQDEALTPQAALNIDPQPTLTTPGGQRLVATDNPADQVTPGETLRTLSARLQRTQEQLVEQDKVFSARLKAQQKAYDQRLTQFQVSQDASPAPSIPTPVITPPEADEPVADEPRLPASAPAVDDPQAPTPAPSPDDLLSELGLDLGFDQFQINTGGSSAGPGSYPSASTHTNSSSNQNGYVHIAPLGSQAAPAFEANSPTSLLSQAGRLLPSLSGDAPSIGGDASASPVSRSNDRPATNLFGLSTPVAQKRGYTIPRQGTLINSVTMTALIGRVPVEGRVLDPYRFKLITGPINLATNGHEIPGVRETVWSGFAHGVREQSCVRAYLDSVTITFDDGSIATQSLDGGGGSSATGQHLAWLSTPTGIPCIQGKYISNASEYLKGRIGTAGLSALAKAFSANQVQTTRSADSDAISTIVSGDSATFLAGNTLAGGLEELTDYIRARQHDSYDLVFVGTGQPVNVHVEKQIELDYDPEGRRLAYEASDASRARDFD